MTVDDLLTLSIRTIKDFPELFHYYAEKEFTYNGIKQLNRNPLLFTELNSDGLKQDTHLWVDMVWCDS